tara:strand:- start:344 stop:1069 length:726 start_codon:yes stop_codon:yes gene_type:complete
MKKSGKIALVIGGSGGIGSAIASRLILDGFKVYSTYYKNSPIKKLKNINYLKCDLLNESDIKNIINLITNDSQYIDVVVFSVSPEIKNTRILDLSVKDIESHFKIQVLSFIKLIQLLKPQFDNKYKTKIINVLTEYCIGKPPKGVAAYLTAKSALLGLSKVLSLELAESKSTVNMISPGMVETKLIENLPKKLIEMTAYNNPLKKIASAEDIANVISFLASNDSDYLNGVNIPINGGNVQF